MTLRRPAGRCRGWAPLGLSLALMACAQPGPTPPAATAQVQARPQLNAAQAAQATVTDYLAQGPTPWQPDARLGAELPPADVVVAADGSGNHRTLQAAIDAVPDVVPGMASAPRRRIHIQLRPGDYRERPCIRHKPPLLISGVPGDAGAVRVVAGTYNALPKRAGTEAAHPCFPDLAAATHGTPGSATLVVASDDLALAHLTIANDAMDGVRGGVGYPAGVGESGGAQAVALLTLADRVQLEQVQLLGHQDTFFVRRPAADAPARVFVRGSLIAGDVDFIFGDATLVVTDSALLSRAGRRAPGEGGHVLAPSTAPGVRLGLLVTRSRFVAEAGVPAGRISLGRAWDAGVARGSWQAGVSPNGQALVRDSEIAPHIGGWSASTSRRPFAATGAQANRMAEFNNLAIAADPAREVLPPQRGWGSAEGGVRGGADAAPQDVFEVRSRAELLRAFSGPPRPRIVKLLGHVNLASDDRGRALGADAWRDPAFSWPAYQAAYEPATWGRRPPQGALEDARRRSAAAQAAHVVVRVPAHTTLLGVGTNARVTGGTLLLDAVQQVIVRNLRLSDAYDHFPAWDPLDGASGHWNSAYDNLSLRQARHVWIDRCRLDDGEGDGDRTDSAEALRFGQRLQRHDGLLDITRQSDFITVSNSHFRQHDKTSLVGGSDSHVGDAGHLRVSFHHNLWDQVKERAPRVRYGQVHVLNNLYLASDPAAHGYSLGLGRQARLLSEHNVWETAPAIRPAQLLRRFAPGHFLDWGSLHNGQPLDLMALWQQQQQQQPAAAADPGWQTPHSPTADPAAEVAPRVRALAGAGRPAWGWVATRTPRIEATRPGVDNAR